ncbi:cyclic peptide export ABC transporter [Pseudomonas sp. PAMC 29040]|uniref:cyclic peptide export ABC transporter n=1 Tax=Pseudomonas sp. PAMC 29040 TaxID=2498450 RepID=UPI000F9FFEC5|nr:cyclic peptide export ABC transporter [Pseudomonas sp. PAMC 29040]NBF17423.1 cyclic peptide export ABC transporter [Pseudomonas sp. Fl4BN2]RUT36959.1 cyclic peptide export ABC transporter [Pseudomonas sp. PAMC 29040]
MSLFGMLVRTSHTRLAVAIGASLVCGLANVLLVALINQALNAPLDGLASYALPFVLVIALVMGSQVLSRALFAYLSQQGLATLRMHISRHVVAAPLRGLEKAGRGRIQAALADDTTTLSNFFTGFPMLVTSAVVVLGCLGYLAYLSWVIFLVSVLAIGLGSLGYHLCHSHMLQYFRKAGASQDELFGHFDAMVSGAKELKLNRSKARRFLDEVLVSAVEQVRRNRAKGLMLFAITGGWGRLLFLVLIGVVLFLRLWVPSDTAVITGYVMVFLYMMGPLEGVLLNLPQMSQARVASARIEATLAQLEAEARSQTPAPAVQAKGVTLELDGLTHGYFSEREDEVFTLGPVTLTLKPGEITFLVGGNGSGKTTLAKLIAGLYVPESGEVRVDGRPVAADGRDDYRQLFSAVFSDFHLFDTLLEAPDSSLDSQASDWLAKLHLEHKVSVSNGSFSTRELSQGQRKRLALIVACLEGRPVIIFDEWAADQDPAFREVFYCELLPELRAQGKTLLVISHDDRYFHLADQLIKLERGQIVSSSSRQSSPAVCQVHRG